MTFLFTRRLKFFCYRLIGVISFTLYEAGENFTVMNCRLLKSIVAFLVD